MMKLSEDVAFEVRDLVRRSREQPMQPIQAEAGGGGAIDYWSWHRRDPQGLKRLERLGVVHGWPAVRDVAEAEARTKWTPRELAAEMNREKIRDRAYLENQRRLMGDGTSPAPVAQTVGEELAQVVRQIRIEHRAIHGETLTEAGAFREAERRVPGILKRARDEARAAKPHPPEEVEPKPGPAAGELAIAVAEIMANDKTLTQAAAVKRAYAADETLFQRVQAERRGGRR